MTKFMIAGAGMAGLLAGAMLRSDCEGILESQKEIPNNHSALLRFRSSVVGDTLGIEFKRVKVIKAVAPWRNPLADALAYSRKATGTYTLRSSLSAKGEMEERFIAPADLISKMAERVQAPILCGNGIDFNVDKRIERNVISTIPMPALMNALKYPRIDEANFQYQHGANINATLSDVNAYGTVYVPDPAIPFSRVSVTGDKLTIEFSGMNAEQIMPDRLKYVNQACELLGISSMSVIGLFEVKDQRYAKILPINEAVRKHFIIWASEQFNVWSLGRFATWRPGLLLDDVVHDVRVIQRLVSAGHAYDHRKA